MANGDLPGSVGNLICTASPICRSPRPDTTGSNAYSGIGRITGGGGKFNLPHSVRGNTFSDIRFDLRGKALFYLVGSRKIQNSRTGCSFPGTILDNIQILPNGPEQ